MRRFLDLLTPNLVARAAVAALLTWLIFLQPFSRPVPPEVPTRLEFGIVSPQPGSVSLRIDEGHGVATNRPANIRATFAGQQSVSLAIPPGQIHALRLSFYSTPSVTLDTCALCRPPASLKLTRGSRRRLREPQASSPATVST